jgi:hypothetical protein
MPMSDAQRKQYAHEIAWLENEIEKLAKEVIKKPRRQRQIDTYRREIEQKKYEIELGI